MAMTKFADERKRAIKDAEKTYNQKVKDLKSDYDTQIFETGRGYEDAYRENAVQKAINERQVAESMANMGLRDSGLNRTQQTAVQLGYANNNAAIDKSKRQAVDSLNLQKTRGLASLKQDWLTQKEGINQTYDNMEKEYKTESTKAYYQHLTDVAKMQNQGIIAGANQKLNRNFFGKLGDNGVTWETYLADNGKEYTKYTDRNTGYSSTFLSNVNPYTATVNYDTKYGVFKDTKYQPTHITVGKNGAWATDENAKDTETLKLDKHTTTYIENLRVTQNVWKTTSKKHGTQYWMWDGSWNQYVEVFENKKTGEWSIEQ